MDFAQTVALRHPFPGQLPAKPVLRHGPAPVLREVEQDTARETAAQIRRLTQAGCKSVAIVLKLPRDCSLLHAQLEKILPDLPIRLLTEDDTEYRAGVMVLPAYLTKGLEFDGVILPDISRKTWPDDVLHARLLYVCLTRPLHHLVCLYQGEATQLLATRKV